MDEDIEEVIKNIIHIDKSASDLREDIERQISERKIHVDDEIEKLRVEIVEKRKEEVRALKNDEIAKANEEGENIIAQAKNRSSEMQKIFDTRKEKLVEDLFGRIMEK